MRFINFHGNSKLMVQEKMGPCFSGCEQRRLQISVQLITFQRLKITDVGIFPQCSFSSKTFTFGLVLHFCSAKCSLVCMLGVGFLIL